MKKVGIVTINDNNNYGNRLQAYALQEFIKQQGFEAYHINFKKSDLKNSLKKCIKYLINYKNQRIKSHRIKIFKKFSNNNINYYKSKIIDDSFFDSYFVGSDQVWNPFFSTTIKENFLTFTSPNKRNSYAASFGISQIPYACQEDYMGYFSSFNKISVREDSGKEIITNLTGRNDVEVLVDPTMLLNKKDWEKIMKKPSGLSNKKYILNYFLGNLSTEKKNVIEEFARKNDLDIVNILDINDKFFLTGPEEFLYLEANAELICTDSFHSVVFALLFDRPFIIFDRDDNKKNMNSRIETLLQKFEIAGKKYNGEISENDLIVDFAIREKLDKEKEKSRLFINEAMEN